MHQHDKSGKWLIQHHGDSILRLAGIGEIVSWRPLRAELVQPRRLPDGLIEGRLPGRDEPDLFVLELATHRDAPADERGNLLTVTQVLAGPRYTNSSLLEILGGEKAMIESPVLQRFAEKATREARRRDILEVPAERFGERAANLEDDLRLVGDEAALSRLVRLAATCADLDRFREQLKSR